MKRFVWALDAHTIAHVHQTEQQHFVWHNIYRNINSFLPIFPHFSGELKKSEEFLSIWLFQFCCCCLNIDVNPSQYLLFLLLFVRKVYVVYWGEIDANGIQNKRNIRLGSFIHIYFINKSIPPISINHCAFTHTQRVDRSVSTPYLQCRLYSRKFEWIYFKSMLWSSLAFANSFCWKKSLWGY